MYEIKCMTKPKEFKTDKSYHVHLITKIRECESNGDLMGKEHYLDLLFKNVYKFLYSQLKKYGNVEKEIEELMPLASISFMKAVKTYDIESPYAFTTLIATCLKNEIIIAYYHRSNRKKTGEKKLVKKIQPSHCLELDRPIPTAPDSTIVDFLVDDNIFIEDNIMSQEILQDVKDYVTSNNNFNQKYKEIYLYYVDCELQDKHIGLRELGEIFNMNTANVSRVVRMIHKAVKKYYNYKYL